MAPMVRGNGRPIYGDTTLQEANPLAYKGNARRGDGSTRRAGTADGAIQSSRSVGSESPSTRSGPSGPTGPGARWEAEAGKSKTFGGSHTFGGTGWHQSMGSNSTWHSMPTSAFSRSASGGFSSFSTDPESDLRRTAGSLPKMDVSRIRELRTSLNVPVGMFPEVRNLTQSSLALETGSAANFMDRRRKHSRSLTDPNMKYNQGAASSHEYGWFTGPKLTYSEHGKPKPPRFPLRSSAETKYYQNMKETHTENAMRLIV